jgi:DNA-binding transcriptional LysR family regulator
MYVCLPKGHPMAGKARLRLEDLRDEAWMTGSSTNCPDSSIFLRACEAAGFQPEIGFQSEDYAAIQGFVAAGMGVSIMPDLALANVRDDVVIRQIAGRAPIRHIVAGTLEGGYRSPAMVAMLEILVEAGAEFQVDRRELAVAV